MEISNRYQASDIESKWYAHWEDKAYFKASPDEREAYAIVIPPPNVTGVLHMGHMLNNTIQDILVRRARLQGKNACWVPGTDHASIATEAKVVKKLRAEGIKKSDIGRDEFMKHAWEWTDKYGGIILQQLKKLGASCNWERTAFTMDESRSKAVYEVFVDLFKKGKVYRGHRMVNWDPEAQTVLSNEEVLYKDETTKLYHVSYKIEGSEDEFVTIATTRPETILGDSAIAVHPDDDRYAHLKGKNAIVPIVNRVVPIIFDDYVEMDFGTGALKVTPAHDTNDYDIGKRHNLETIDVLTPDGKISEAGQFFVGMGRFKARTELAKQLEEMGQLLKQENYKHSVGRSERTNAVVEPRLSLQWYVDMPSLAKPALDAVLEGDIQFFPDNAKNTYRHWMENIRDWCISRQLWWGHRIPAYYLDQGPDKEELVFVALSPEEALEDARTQTQNDQLQLTDLKQDEDVLDTWFSSWLWPISVFNGFENSEDFNYYYPTAVLVTAPDIIFLWVARMIMSGYEWKNQLPFKHVYFTGMVRDKKRRKMSKSLGNSPDALQLISEFGADGVRFGMLSCSPAGGDLLFDEKLVEQGRNFCNKLWNALRLIKGWEVVEENESTSQADINALAIRWFEHKMKQVVSNIDGQFDQYRLSEVLIQLYSFIWGDFCSWYLEMIKPAKGNKIDRHSYEKTLQIFEQLCTLLHPFMPFITEEIWHQLASREEGNDCMMSSYPTIDTSFDIGFIKQFEQAKDIISNVRDARNKHGLKRAELLNVQYDEAKEMNELLSHDGMKAMLMKMAMLENLEKSSTAFEHAHEFISGTAKLYVALAGGIDEAAEKERLTKELDHAKSFVAGIEKKLSNERFVNNAPEAVVANERKKMADGQERMKMIEEALARLN